VGVISITVSRPQYEHLFLITTVDLSGLASNIFLNISIIGDYILSLSHQTFLRYNGKNQTYQAAFENTPYVSVVGKTAGCLDGGAAFGSSRVSQPERDAVSSPQSDIQHRLNNQ